MLLQTITAVIVAVAPIQVEPYQDAPDWAPTVYEHLTNSVADYATVVERDQLDKVLAEQKLGMTGLIDLSTAAEVGKLLGANYIIISKITGKNHLQTSTASHSIYLEISSRLLNVKTGSAKRGLNARIDRHKRNDKKLHWHIDFLLAAKSAKVTSVDTFEFREGGECALNQSIIGEHIVRGFGASDCRNGCKSHLVRVGK